MFDFLRFIENWRDEREDAERLGVDALTPDKECALFSLGDEVVGRKPDILGGELVQHRFTFLLVSFHQRDPEEGDLEPYFLMNRVAESLIYASREDEHVSKAWAEGAHLKSMTKEGLARYEMKVIFEYTTEE